MVCLQVMIGVFCMCTVWGEPLSQTAQSFMPELIYGRNRNLTKVWLVNSYLKLVHFIFKEASMFLIYVLFFYSHSIVSIYWVTHTSGIWYIWAIDVIVIFIAFEFVFCHFCVVTLRCIFWRAVINHNSKGKGSDWTYFYIFYLKVVGSKGGRLM